MTFLSSTADFICLTFLLHSQPQLSPQSWDASSFPLQKLQMLTPVHTDTDNANNTDDADNYNRVIDIAQMKAFSCANKVCKWKLAINCWWPYKASVM